MADPTKTPAVTKPARLSEADFVTCVDLYERGINSLSELADKFKITRQALHKRLQDAGIKKNSRAGEAVVAPAERFVDNQARYVEETRMQGYQSLRQVQMIARKIALDAMKALKPMSSVDEDLKAVGRLNKILCDNIQTTLRVLKADDFVDELDLPSLQIEDLTDEDILDHHIGTGALPEGTTIQEMLDGGELDPESDR